MKIYKYMARMALVEAEGCFFKIKEIAVLLGKCGKSQGI